MLLCSLLHLICIATIKTITEELELTPTTVQTLEKCNVCKGVPFEDQVNCRCTESLWWNGDTCVAQQECPCVVGHITYATRLFHTPSLFSNFKVNVF